jgi:hypothetical protein
MSSVTSLRGGLPFGLGISGLTAVSLRASSEGVVSVSAAVCSGAAVLSSSSPQAATPSTATTAMRIRTERSIGGGILMGSSILTLDRFAPYYGVK